MRRSNHENIDVLMLIGLVTEGEEEGEGGGGKSHSKVGTLWVRQQLVTENINILYISSISIGAPWNRPQERRCMSGLQGPQPSSMSKIPIL